MRPNERASHQPNAKLLIMYMSINSILSVLCCRIIFVSSPTSTHTYCMFPNF